MSVSVLFVCGLALTLLTSLAVVTYLSTPLRRQLQELCGNAERAEFWSVFSKVTVTLVPLIFAMQFQPQSQTGEPPLLLLVSQLKWGLVGLVASVLALGWMLSRFIPRRPIPPPAWATGQKQG